MMFKDVVTIKPYYVVPKDYTITTEKRQETVGMDKIIPLPDYKIEMPSKKLVKCLQLIDDHEDGKVSKKYKGGSLNCHSLASVAITPPPYIKSLFILQKLIANESHISI